MCTCRDHYVLGEDGASCYRKSLRHVHVVNVTTSPHKNAESKLNTCTGHWGINIIEDLLVLLNKYAIASNGRYLFTNRFRAIFAEWLNRPNSVEHVTDFSMNGNFFLNIE